MERDDFTSRILAELVNGRIALRGLAMALRRFHSFLPDMFVWCVPALCCVIAFCRYHPHVANVWQHLATSERLNSDVVGLIIEFL